MAMIEDVFKGNLATGLVVGLGVVLLGPTLIQTMGRVLRPAAKAVIRSGLLFYRETLGEIGEMANDLVTEARAELEGEVRADGERGGVGVHAPAGAEEHQPAV
jgi:hypothetical protein